jgi:hypothetical protein
MRNTWRKNTKRWMIAELAVSGLTKTQTYDRLRPLVVDQVKPLIFQANVDGHRVPKPMHEQLQELRYEIGRVWKELGKAKDSSFESEEIPQEEIPQEDESEEEIPQGEDESEEEIPEEEIPIKKSDRKIFDELDYFDRRVEEIREFCRIRKERQNVEIDNISIRWTEAACRLIPRKIPADALIAAGTMHWSPETRSEAGIKDFDFAKLSLEIMRDRGIDPNAILIPDKPRLGTPHILFGYALVLAEARQPIYLVGPAGTGKSHLLRQLAAYMGVQYAETPMSQGATRGDLLGRHTVDGFIPAAFLPIYSGGGVFNFEEIDASDPSLLIVLNNALAGDALYNSSDGEMYSRSDDFIASATANTLALGANREYTGRDRLDAATIDRWRMGRIFLPLDRSIEKAMYARAKANL